MIVKNMFEKKNGFTMAELLMSIAIIGFLAVLTIPLLKQTIPDKYDAMYKKGTYALEQTVSEIVNDDYLYAEKKTVTKTDDGYDVQYTNGIKNTDTVNYNGVNYGGANKFCRLFASKFNFLPGTGENCVAASVSTFGFSNDGDSKKPSFVSNDYIEWLIPVSNFTSNELIAFKVTLAGKNGSNCAYIPNNDSTFTALMNSYGWTKLTQNRNLYSDTKTYYAVGSDDKSYCEHPDTFVYIITPEGKLIKPEIKSDEMKKRTL